jgi:hypothetical protein
MTDENVTGDRRLAAGGVVSVQWGDQWQGGADDWDYRPMLSSSGDGGRIVAWRTTDWRLHYTDTSTDTGTGGSVDQRVAAIRQATTAAGLTPGSITDDRPVRIGTAISLLVALFVVALLVNGPVPMIGTRWYWWWIFVGLPFGLGLVYWLWRERPWSRTAEVPLGPPNRDPRRRWYLGILAGLLASMVVGLATALLRHLLGDGIVPNP